MLKLLFLQKELKKMIKMAKRLKYCNQCKNIWSFRYKDFTILRIDLGKKAKIISEKCYICRLKNGEFEYKKLLDFLIKNSWSLEDSHKYLIKATYIPNPQLFYMLPKNNEQSDFSIRMEQLLQVLEIAYPVSNIKNNLIEFIFS